MSVVTGITLHLGHHDESNPLERIHQWIARHSFPPLKKQLAAEFGGNKHPQIQLWTAGYNYFPNEEFITFFLCLRNSWTEPETVVLIVNTEEGPATVVRGTDLD